MADTTAPIPQASSASSNDVEDKKVVSNTPDVTLTCKQCNKDFVFSGGEQDFYTSKGYDKSPLRCRECRRARKAAIRARGRGRFRGRGRGRGRGGFSENGGDESEIPRRQPPAGAQPGQCYAFLQGGCKYGDQCRYSHQQQQ